MMENWIPVTQEILVLWVTVAGLAYMVRGPRGAAAVVRWPIVAVVRLLRRTIGWVLVALGHWIRG